MINPLWKRMEFTKPDPRLKQFMSLARFVNWVEKKRIKIWITYTVGARASATYRQVYRHTWWLNAVGQVQDTDSLVFYRPKDLFKKLK